MGMLLRRLSRRRRPRAHARFVNVLDEPEPSPPPPPKRGIMHKLSNWLGDHLRKSHSSSSNFSACSTVSARPSAASTLTASDQRHPGPANKPAPARPAQIRVLNNQMPMLGSARDVKRRAICTNPWFVPEERMLSSFYSDPLNASYSSTLSGLTRDESLRINTMAGSACSSGYASQDSSPECSVHHPSWQPSSQLQSRGNLVDKAVECTTLSDYDHIYHELELSGLGPASSGLCERAEDDSCFSEELASSCGDSRPASPIYAVPYSSAGESRCGSIDYADDSDAYEDLARRHALHLVRQPAAHAEPSCAPLRPHPASAFSPCRPQARRPPPPVFTAPPPPPLDQGLMDCLDVLDQQIAQLKKKTEVVSRLVEDAKERRELRGCARLLCMEHINQLRSMRWYVENGFELQL